MKVGDLTQSSGGGNQVPFVLAPIMNSITGNEPSVFARFVPFVGYYLLGYLLRDMKLSRTGVIRAGAGFIASYLVLLLGTGWTVHLFHTPGTFLKGPPSLEMLQYDFLSPVRIIMAICAWLLFVNLFNKPRPASETAQLRISWWASTTLGIYLVHPMFREILYTRRIWIPGVYQYWIPYHFGPEWPNIWLGIPVMVLIVYGLSFTFTALVMRIPYVRRIAG